MNVESFLGVFWNVRDKLVLLMFGSTAIGFYKVPRLKQKLQHYFCKENSVFLGELAANDPHGCLTDEAFE